MTVLPQASGMAIARVPRMTGAFHGAMPTTTPAAWRMPIASDPGTSDGMTSPLIWVVIEAASRSILAASVTLNWYHIGLPPASATPRATKSARRPSMASAALSSSVRRAPGLSADQAGKASLAALTALSTSASWAAAARVTTSPLAGLRRSKVVLSWAAWVLPPMSRSVSNMVGVSFFIFVEFNHV